MFSSSTSVFTFKAKPSWARSFCVWCEERRRLSSVGTHMFSTSFEKIILVSLNYSGAVFRNQLNVHMRANVQTRSFTPLSTCLPFRQYHRARMTIALEQILKPRDAVFLCLFLRVSRYHWFSATWLWSAVMRFSLFCFGSLSCLYLWVCTFKLLHNVRQCFF